MIVAGLWAKSASAAEGDNAYAKQRAALVAEIEDDYRRTVGYTGLERMSEPVRKAMLAVPRHEFVRTDGTAEAYGNYPLGIGHGQTISQPYIVALMTDLLAVEANHRVLEIGTGSGYQAAVLSEIAARVYTIEIVKPLADAARERLARLGYDDVQVRAGDGNLGWPSEAPFDGIIVTAAGNIPPALVEQLKPGGRLVIPIDLGGGSQELTVVTKAQDGSISKRPVLPVRFVPLTGDN
jgi:protein-L-isoaspartate(D-aspartate) O-methyltransferase